jgi:hypothetical protein
LVNGWLSFCNRARKTGWDVPMLVQTAGYSAQVPALGGKATEGLYGTPLTPPPVSGPCEPQAHSLDQLVPSLVEELKR